MPLISLDSLTDLCTPWCVHVIVTLGVPDRLVSGPASIEDLAGIAGADPEALSRVLRHLIGKGLFESPAPGVFALNDAARQLTGPSVRVGLGLDGIGGRMAHSWSTLLTAVRTGRPAYREVFGREFWDDLAAHPEVAASFDALMGPAGHATPDPEVLLSGDWTGIRTVVDVGGGTGSLLAAILAKHPTIRGVLVDQPATVARAADILEPAGVADRVSLAGQSFFDPLPAGADLYLLKSILFDWPDAKPPRSFDGRPKLRVQADGWSLSAALPRTRAASRRRSSSCSCSSAAKAARYRRSERSPTTLDCASSPPGGNRRESTWSSASRIQTTHRGNRFRSCDSRVGAGWRVPTAAAHRVLPSLREWRRSHSSRAFVRLRHPRHAGLDIQDTACIGRTRRRRHRQRRDDDRLRRPSGELRVMAPRSHARLGYPLVSGVVLPEHRDEARHGSRTRVPAEVRVRQSGSVERAHDILARRIAADLARRTAPVPVEALSGHVAGQRPRERDRACRSWCSRRARSSTRPASTTLARRGPRARWSARKRAASRIGDRSTRWIVGHVRRGTRSWLFVSSLTGKDLPLLAAVDLAAKGLKREGVILSQRPANAETTLRQHLRQPCAL